jgi:DNA-binding NarL/FixJ family response regulator
MTKASDVKIGVLIIDDHLMFAESLKRLLDDEVDIEVVGITAGGLEAMTLADRLQPDVIIVDYALPASDGVELTAAIKHKHPEVKAIMLTGTTADDRLLLAAVASGCSGFLTKDRAASEMARAVRNVIAGGAPVSPPILARLFPMLGRADQTEDRNLTQSEREVVAGLLRQLLR